MVFPLKTHGAFTGLWGTPSHPCHTLLDAEMALLHLNVSILPGIFSNRYSRNIDKTQTEEKVAHRSALPCLAVT
jgi:hypothetical protein